MPSASKGKARDASPAKGKGKGKSSASKAKEPIKPVALEPEHDLAVLKERLGRGEKLADDELQALELDVVGKSARSRARRSRWSEPGGG